MTKSHTILVSGCAGFIGSNFSHQFKTNYPETEIIGIDDFSTGRRSALDPEVTFYEGSITDEALLGKIFKKHKPTHVFHFAAVPRVSYSIEYPRLTTEANVVGTVALLEAAKQHGTKRFIYSASSSVYGGAKQLPTTEADNSPNPKSPYAIQKYSGELFGKVYSQLSDMDTVALRYFNVFGPGQYGDSPYSSVVSGWLESLYFPAHQKAYLEGDGEQSRDFCYIDNVVQANILAMRASNKLNGEVFNIAYGERTTLNQVKLLIEEYTGKKLELEKRPPRLGDVRHSLADISKARNNLGYDPKISFRDGLKLTVDWFKSRQA